MSILLDGGHLRLCCHGMLGKHEPPRRLWQIRGVPEASTARRNIFPGSFVFTDLWKNQLL